MKISQRVSKFLSRFNFQTENFQMEKIPYKLQLESWFLFSIHCLMALYICAKLSKNISKGFKVIERHDFHIVIFTKGHDSIKNVVSCSLHIV